MMKCCSAYFLLTYCDLTCETFPFYFCFLVTNIHSVIHSFLNLRNLEFEITKEAIVADSQKKVRQSERTETCLYWRQIEVYGFIYVNTIKSPQYKQ